MNIPTKAAQETVLGEGLAIGAMMLGVRSLVGDKTSLELDFRRAWRKWKFAALFPAVHAGLADDSLFRILRSSSKRTTLHIARWVGGWPYAPELLVEWSLEEAAGHIDDRLGASAWVSLVGDWLNFQSPLDEQATLSRR